MEDDVVEAVQVEPTRPMPWLDEIPVTFEAVPLAGGRVGLHISAVVGGHGRQVSNASLDFVPISDQKAVGMVLSTQSAETLYRSLKRIFEPPKAPSMEGVDALSEHFRSLTKLVELARGTGA